MKTPIVVLVSRVQYPGGRKYRSARKKLGKKTLNELSEAGIQIDFVPRKKS